MQLRKLHSRVIVKRGKTAFLQLAQASTAHFHPKPSHLCLVGFQPKPVYEHAFGPGFSFYVIQLPMHFLVRVQAYTLTFWHPCTAFPQFLPHSERQASSPMTCCHSFIEWHGLLQQCFKRYTFRRPTRTSEKAQLPSDYGNSPWLTGQLFTVKLG